MFRSPRARVGERGETWPVPQTGVDASLTHARFTNESCRRATARACSPAPRVQGVDAVSVSAVLFVNSRRAVSNLVLKRPCETHARGSSLLLSAAAAAAWEASGAGVPAGPLDSLGRGLGLSRAAVGGLRVPQRWRGRGFFFGGGDLGARGVGGLRAGGRGGGSRCPALPPAVCDGPVRSTGAGGRFDGSSSRIS